MRPSLFSLAAVLSLFTVASASTIACGGASEDSMGSGDGTTADGADEEINAAVFGDEDNGKTVQVVAGRAFTIALSDDGASTGYAWMVTAVDRSLGYPKESSIPGDASRPGSPGTKKFTWSAKSTLGLVGKRGQTCGAGTYCAFSAKAACGIADQTGTCHAKPRLCPMVIMPVCGCDGKTYNNGCQANRAETSVHASGPCAH